MGNPIDPSTCDHDVTCAKCGTRFPPSTEVIRDRQAIAAAMEDTVEPTRYPAIVTGTWDRKLQFLASHVSRTPRALLVVRGERSLREVRRRWPWLRSRVIVHSEVPTYDMARVTEVAVEDLSALPAYQRQRFEEQETPHLAAYSHGGDLCDD